MTNKVYYSTAKIGDFTPVLKGDINNHCKTQESALAWGLLAQKYQETFGKELGKVSFEKSCKPFIDNGYISLSHSNGVVAVCFSKTTLTAIDIELVKETLPKNTAEFIGVNNSPDFYKKWTQRECVIKAKNYSALKKGAESEFIGFSTEFLVEKKAFYLSVYGKNAEFIKV